VVVSFIVFWPIGLRPSHLPEMEWTHVLLETQPLRPLVPDPTAVKHAAKPVRNGAHGSAALAGAAAAAATSPSTKYREETLRKLDEEQREFRDFLDRLRAAKDRSEFDQFMNERRNRPPAPEPPPARIPRRLRPPLTPSPRKPGGVRASVIEFHRNLCSTARRARSSSTANA